MQISLRSQMIAGTTALVGATAIAMTPIAPAVSLPSLNVSNAAVKLAATVTNPIDTLLQTGNLAITYLIDGDYTQGAGGGEANWGSGIGTNSGITDTINTLIQNTELGGQYFPAIRNIGLVPNFLTVPFPVGIQVVNNWLGYAGVAVQTGADVLGDLSGLLWTPVALTIAIADAVISGAIDTIPGLITDAIQNAIGSVTSAVQSTIAGASLILNSVVTKATAVITNLSTALPSLLTAIQGQATALVNSVTSNVAAISAAIAGGDLPTIWNTTVESLLGPTGIPGTILNLTLGAGVQDGVGTAGYVPSVRAVVQTLGQSISGALGTAPTSAAAVRSAAAAKKAAPAAEVAAVAADSAPAAAAAAPAKKAPAAAGARRAAAAKAAAAK